MTTEATTAARPRAAARWAAALLALAALAGTARAAVESKWVRADVNGDGTQEWIAQTNLMDLAFNERG